MTAREAVERALADSSAVNHFSIQRFWMSLYEYGFQVTPRPIDWSGPKCQTCGFPEHSDGTMDGINESKS